MKFLQSLWLGLWGQAYLLLVLTTLMWAGNGIAGRLAIGEVSPMVLTCLRWVFVVAILLLLVPDTGDLDIDGGLPAFLAQAMLFLVYLVLLVAGRGAFRVPRRSKRRLASGTSHAQTAKELLRRWGGDTISWMTTWPENRHLITADGEGYLAFRRHVSLRALRPVATAVAVGSAILAAAHALDAHALWLAPVYAAAFVAAVVLLRGVHLDDVRTRPA